MGYLLYNSSKDVEQQKAAAGSKSSFDVLYYEGIAIRDDGRPVRFTRAFNAESDGGKLKEYKARFPDAREVARVSELRIARDSRNYRNTNKYDGWGTSVQAVTTCP